MNIQHLITEIRTLKGPASRKNAHDIFQLLNNNKQLFVKHMDSANLELMLRDLEGLGNSGPAEQNSEAFKREYERALQLLLFYLDKII